MQHGLDNVILFPKWKSSLEEESIQALQQQNYSTALNKLNQLIQYDVTSHEIIFGKLICLVELGHNEEAQELCEQQLGKQCENYYDYVHLYLNILFQTEQYSLLMEQVEYELTNKMLPEALKGQFRELHTLSQKMNNDIIAEKVTEQQNKLQKAIEEENDLNQWRLIRNLHKHNSEPTNEIISLLQEKSVHPVTKTAILNWLQEKNIKESVVISKFDKEITVKPYTIPQITDHELYKMALQCIYKNTQKNPTLTNLLEQILYRYLFVVFPFMPNAEDIATTVEAITEIGKQNLHISNRKNKNDSVEKLMSEIELYETLYLSIIEE